MGDKTNDIPHQKLLTSGSDDVIPDDDHGEPSYDDAEKKKSPPGDSRIIIN